jgi:hypothetical protein
MVYTGAAVSVLPHNSSQPPSLSTLTTDISWLDWAYKSSTFDVMYRRQRRHLQYIMVVKFWNTICPPPRQFFFHWRAALSSNSNGTRPYIAERTQNAVYIHIVRCLWLFTGADGKPCWCPCGARSYSIRIYNNLYHTKESNEETDWTFVKFKNFGLINC